MTLDGLAILGRQRWTRGGIRPRLAYDTYHVGVLVERGCRIAVPPLAPSQQHNTWLSTHAPYPSPMPPGRGHRIEQRLRRETGLTPAGQVVAVEPRQMERPSEIEIRRPLHGEPQLDTELGSNRSRFKCRRLQRPEWITQREGSDVGPTCQSVERRPEVRLHRSSRQPSQGKMLIAVRP